MSYSGPGVRRERQHSDDGAVIGWEFSGHDFRPTRTQSDSGNYTRSAFGSPSNGGVRLSSYVLSGGSSGSSSQSASEADTLKTLDISTMSGGRGVKIARTPAAGQRSNEIYQSGVETAGS